MCERHADILVAEVRCHFARDDESSNWCKAQQNVVTMLLHSFSIWCVSLSQRLDDDCCAKWRADDICKRGMLLPQGVAPSNPTETTKCHIVSVTGNTEYSEIIFLFMIPETALEK